METTHETTAEQIAALERRIRHAQKSDCLGDFSAEATPLLADIAALLASLRAEAAPAAPVEDALRKVWGDIVVRWNAMITPGLNYPDSSDLLDIMGHVNEAFRAALSLPSPATPTSPAGPAADVVALVREWQAASAAWVEEETNATANRLGRAEIALKSYDASPAATPQEIP